jgi:TonB family protein
MNWKRLLRMRRLRALGPVSGKEEWKLLPRGRRLWWERILLEGAILVLPAALVLFVPNLAGRLRSGVHDPYRLSIIEKKVVLPEGPPPEPMPVPEPPDIEEKKEAKKRPVCNEEEEQEKEEPEEPEEEKKDDFNPYGMDEGSLAKGPGSGFAVPVGDSLMGKPGERKMEKKVEPPAPSFPPKKNRPKVYDEGQVTKQPRCLEKALPRYTDRALDGNIVGKVVLMVLFDERGEAKSIEIMSGPGYGLEESCVEAVKKSKYSPAILDGKPVPCKMKITFNFTLE